MAFPGGKHGTKYLFILFIVVVCVYLLPRVAINAFYYPDNKVYGQAPWSAESVTFTAKDGTRLHGWFIPSATGPTDNAVATVIHVHGNAGNMSAHWPLVGWSAGCRNAITTFSCSTIADLANLRARLRNRACMTIRKALSTMCAGAAT